MCHRMTDEKGQEARTNNPLLLFLYFLTPLTKLLSSFIFPRKCCSNAMLSSSGSQTRTNTNTCVSNVIHKL